MFIPFRLFVFLKGGCYSGQQALKASDLAMEDPKATPVTCRQFCATQNSLYAALAGTSCTCFKEQDVHVLHAQELVPASACETSCLEDQSQICGGANAVNVFNLGNISLSVRVFVSLLKKYIFVISVCLLLASS